MQIYDAGSILNKSVSWRDLSQDKAINANSAFIFLMVRLARAARVIMEARVVWTGLVCYGLAWSSLER